MNRYPKLSTEQQQNLPTLKQVTPWPALFEDSTHQLWHCDTTDGEFMLKVCNIHNVKTSTFWQGMSSLFDVQLPAQLAYFKTVYNTVAEHGTLFIPDYIASDSGNANNGQAPYILTKMMSGSMLNSQHINDEMVKGLVKHISQLHSYKQGLWGKAIQAEFELSDWSKRLQATLKIMAKKQAISSALFAEALEQARMISPSYAVLIMPDIRWDQFLQNKDQLTTLVDLDAFVYAPRELELILLEIILDDQQAVVFIKQYQQKHTLPNLSKVRKVYRLLLFLMNVLGEKDIEAWMSQPYKFDKTPS